MMADNAEEKVSKYQAPALEKGLDILEYLSRRAMPLSQTEIANGINKNPNEIYRMLVCLEERGYLMREEHSAKYMLSLKLYNLSHRHSPVDDIRRASQYPMQELANKLKQSCHLSVLYHDQLMVVYQAKSPSPIALSIEEGSLFPLVLTASGRTLLAFMAESERLNILGRIPLYRSYSARKQKGFLESLEEIRERGIYVGTSELSKGVTDIVMPIGDEETGVLACLAVSILTTQYDEDFTSEQIVAEVQQCVKNILGRLGM
jgi:DNA-binding IclR family transcriptional regulator